MSGSRREVQQAKGSLLQCGLDGAQDRRWIGELARGLLGIDALSAQGDFEHAPGGGNQFERPDFELETQQLRRQTDGVGFVVSGRAILDDDFRFHGRADTTWESR